MQADFPVQNIVRRLKNRVTLLGLGLENVYGEGHSGLTSAIAMP